MGRGKRNFSLFNLHSSLSFLLAGVFALATGSAWAAPTTIYWKGGNGSETAPVNIYDKSCWSTDSTYSGSGNNISLFPSSYHNLNFGFASGAEDTTAWLKCDGNTVGTAIATVFQTHSGHFIFTSGSFKTGSNFSVGRSSGDETVVTKKGGDWTIGGNLYIGYDSKTSGLLEVDGGSISVSGDSYIGNSGKGTLTINGGSVEVASSKVTRLGANSGSSGTVNLNGGVLKTSRLYQSQGGTLNFNGGTLQANAANSDGFIGSGVTVNVNAGGGVIDCGGYAIKINADLNGTGGLLFTGGNRIDIGNVRSHYSGATAVTPGTTLAVYMKGDTDKILSSERGLIVAGVPKVGDEIFILTRGDGYTISEDQLQYVTCPLAPDTVFELGEGSTNILVKTVGATIDNYWTGNAGDNNLSNAANWKNGVPSDNANIFVTNAVTLTKGDSFAPKSITFLAGSAPVTINGGDFTDIVAITNNSALSHTINAKVCFAGDIQVKQAAMAETGDLTKAHVTFAGGAYAAPGCSLESGSSAAVYSRCIFGKYYLASTAENRWTAANQGGSKRICLADDSSLYIPYAGVLTELYIGNGAKVDVGDMLENNKSAARLSYQSYGEMIVSNLTVTGSANIHATWEQGIATPGVFKFNTVTNGIIGGSSGNAVFLCDGKGAAKHVFYIGEGGLNYSSTSSMSVFYLGLGSSGNYETIRPWYSDFTIGERPGGAVGLRLRRDVEFCTDDERGTGRTITVDAITGAQDTPTITVSGSGTLKVNKTANNTVQPPITVTDTATLQYATSTATLGTGAITLGAGTTLALTSTGSTFTPIANTINLPAEGKAKIRIDGKRLKSGNHVIATVGTGTNVELDRNSSVLYGRKWDLIVNEGKLILNIKSNGFIMIFR